MSHIVSFRIEGLAGKKEPLELELQRDTNIFFGLNGSGKTSLLKILHAAMENDTSTLLRVPFSAAEVSIYSLTWDKVFTRSIKKPKIITAVGHATRGIEHRKASIRNEVVVLNARRSAGELTWSCSPSTPKEASSTIWANTYLPTTRLHISDKPYPLALERKPSELPWLTEEQLDSVFTLSVEHLWSRYSAQVLGAVRMAQEQGLASILRAVLSAESAKQKHRRLTSKLTPTTAYSRVQNFLKRQGGTATLLGTQAAFEKRYIDDPTLQNIVQDIDSVEDKIEAAMASRNRLQELITRMFTGNKEIRFTDESIEVQIPSGEKIGLASLSSGEKHLLRIFVEALLAGQSSMMIDEPELSMHIDWQRNLISSLRALNNETQLIFATHSPEIMADVPDNKIFRI